MSVSAETLAQLAALDISNRYIRDRLQLVLGLTADPSQLFTTAAAFRTCGHTDSLAHEALKGCFYEVMHHNPMWRRPRLYKFDRLARAFIQVLLDRHQAAAS